MVAVKGWFYTHLQRQSVPTHGFLRKWQDPKPPEKYALFSERSAHVSAPVAPVFNLTILTGNKVPKYEYRDTQKTTMPHQLSDYSFLARNESLLFNKLCNQGAFN